MKKFTLVALAMMASASCFAQTTLWDGEDKSIGADHTSNGFWDRCNPVVAENPAKDGINTSDKCVKFRISGKEWNNGCIGLSLPNGEDGLDVSQCKRFSILIKKSTNSVVNVELANGKANYWKHIAANYTGNGEWQKLVFDFSVHSSAFESKNPVEFVIYPDIDGEDTNEDIYVDNIVLEANPTVNDGLLWNVAENSLKDSLKLTGGYFKTTCINADVDPWESKDIDDFNELNKKLSAGVTSIDMRNASTIGVDINQFFKNPNTIVYADADYGHANVVVNGTANSLVLTDANAFNAPEDFKATSVTLKRDVLKGVNSFVLPFEVKADDLGATQVATYKDCELGTVANFITDESVAANTPFLTMDVAEDKATAELNFGEKAIVATPKTLGTDFVGVYAPQKAEGMYGIDGNGKLHKGGAGATIAAFHAYLNVTGSGSAPTSVAFIGSTPTAINGVAADKVANTAVYDLSGRRVYGKLQKGLYIMNGKKVVVK
mgnify:CR=1 FL=1